MPRSDRRAKDVKKGHNKTRAGGGGAKKKAEPPGPRDGGVSVDINAMLEEIERKDTPVEEKQPKTGPQRARRKGKGAKSEGLTVKPGTTVAQARVLADKMEQKQRITANGAGHFEGQRSEKDEEGEEDEDQNQEGSGEDYSDIANERPSEYRKGGYHPVVVGEVYNERYRVVRKLGWGYFSTVWLVWDYVEEVFQAMKVQKSARHYTEAAYDEMKLLGEIMTADPDRRRRCARLNDHFEQVGPNGKHVCMVFDVYGEDLLSLIERYKYNGVPLPIVKCTSRQILVGLEHVHSLDIIHTDLKPENVLLSAPKHAIVSQMKHFKAPPLHDRPSLVKRDQKTMTKSQRRRYYKKLRAVERAKGSSGEKERPVSGEVVAEVHADPCESLPQENEGEPVSETDSEWEVERLHHVVLADFGNSCWTYRQFTDEVQTRQYRSPEVILGYPYSTSIDLWSAACMIFELITGEFLFDPRKGDDYSRDEDHLALISELLGVLPESMRLGNGKYRAQYYNSRGELRSIKDLKFWALEDVLCQKHKFTPKKAKEIAEFLLPMLELEPQKRATATHMLDNFQHFFEVQDDDYAPLCFITPAADGRSGERSSINMGESVYTGSYEETDDDDRSERLDSTFGGIDRSLGGGDEEVARYLAAHSLLREESLAKRGLNILDIQAVLSGQQLDTEERHAAATEIIRLLSEEGDDSSDGHCADKEDGGSSSSADESENSRVAEKRKHAN